MALSGTPLTQDPLSIFGQARFLDPGWFGDAWTQFHQRFALHANPKIPQQVTGYRNLDELQATMSHFTFRCTEAVLDLPEKHHIDRPFKLSTAGTDIYHNLEEELIAQVGTGVVTASNALVKLLRLQQITSGFCQPEEQDTYVEIDDAKLEVLQEILEDLPQREPVIVFCRFRHDLHRIEQLVTGLGRRYGEISGRRKDLTEHATMPANIDVMGVQIQSGGVGIDLTRAAYAIYYSLGFSLLEYDQSIARLHRPGQTRPVHYYHLVAEKTVDEIIYSSMRRRREIIDAVLESLHGPAADAA
jgi:SNF2 family DNA or RNA helicase